MSNTAIKRFKIGMKVKAKDDCSDLTSPWAYGKVIEIHDNSIIIQWEDIPSPVVHDNKDDLSSLIIID